MDSWHDNMDFALIAFEYVGTFAGAISGVRLATRKRFDWFGAYVIGFITALGGGTLRDILLRIDPFWMNAPRFLITTFLAVVAVWIFGRKFISGEITWFIADTIAIAVFMIFGLEKALAYGKNWWVALIMGIITAVFGGILRDICINEVPLIFRKELYALACAAGGVVYILMYLVLGIPDRYICTLAGVVTIFLLRVFAIQYHLGVPVLTGREVIQLFKRRTKKAK